MWSRGFAILPEIRELRGGLSAQTETERVRLITATRAKGPRRKGPRRADGGTIATLYKISNPLVKSFLQTLSFLYFFANWYKSVYFQGVTVKPLAAAMSV